MARIKNQESPKIRLIRWQEELSLPKKGSEKPLEEGNRANMVWMQKGTRVICAINV